jgi:hypothetical protein
MATQLDRLNTLLDEQEATVAAAFRDFIADTNSEFVFKEIADRLEAGDVEGALAIVDSHVMRFANVLPTIQQTAGIAAAAELANLATSHALAITFDPSHPRAAQLARANRLLLVREFTDEQRAATRQALARAFEQGTGTAGTARAFRNSIGLTRGQEAWVARYEQELRNFDRNALNRALRDRRYDKGTLRAIELKQPLTEAQIQARVDRYRLRALMMRSETIARTESIRATSSAREEALVQMLEQTGMDPRRIARVWHATHDGRTRGWHADMEGQQRSMGEAFEDGRGNAVRYPGDPLAPPETSINCRCTLTYETRELTNR